MESGNERFLQNSFLANPCLLKILLGYLNLRSRSETGQVRKLDEVEFHSLVSSNSTVGRCPEEKKIVLFDGPMLDGSIAILVIYLA